MVEVYTIPYVFHPSHLETTQTSVGGVFLGNGYCYLSLIKDCGVIGWTHYTGMAYTKMQNVAKDINCTLYHNKVRIMC